MREDAMAGLVEALRIIHVSGRAERADRSVTGYGTEFTSHVQVGDTIRIVECDGVFSGLVAQIVDGSHLVLA